MKWLVGAACIAVIAASSVYLAKEYSAYAERSRADKLAAMATFTTARHELSLQKALQDSRDDDRLEEIGQKGCDQAAIDIIWVSTTRPIKKSDDIPPQIRQDIRTCLKHEKINAADLAKIKEAGLYDLAAN